MSNIIKYKIANGLIFYAPENDSVVPGTIEGLKRNNWHFDKIDFKNNDIFIDIGCSLGLVSMCAAKLFPFIKIYAFDANPLAIDCFKKSCQENEIKNIEIFNLAVGRENKKDIKFLTYSENESCLIQEQMCGNKNARNFEYFCDIISVDDVYDKIVNKNVKLLKVDIETGEFDLFNHIFEKRIDILDKTEFLHLEIHPFTGEERSEKLKQQVKEKFKEKVLF